MKKQNNLLELKNLSVWYTKEKKILSDFSLELGSMELGSMEPEPMERGSSEASSMELGGHEVVGLIGLNGAGKTTFMKTLAGLLNTYRVKEATFQGKKLDFRDNSFKCKRYVVFAEEHSFQYFTFNEYIGYIAAAYGKEMTDVEELVQGFHFEAYTDVLLKELSTGNLKKVYLITAFALKPELLLLDEPVNGLDFQSTEYLYQLMGAYKEHGTLLFSSHILESISLTSDRVLVLENGRITKEFKQEEINAQNIREVLAEDEAL